jgi:hypothetical protein
MTATVIFVRAKYRQVLHVKRRRRRTVRRRSFMIQAQ